MYSQLMDTVVDQLGLGEYFPATPLPAHIPRFIAHSCIILLSSLVVHCACRASYTFVKGLETYRLRPWVYITSTCSALVPSIILSLLLLANMYNIKEEGEKESKEMPANVASAQVAASIASHSLPMWFGGIAMAFVLKDMLVYLNLFDKLWAPLISHVYQQVSLSRRGSGGRMGRVLSTCYDIRLFGLVLGTLAVSDLYLTTRQHWVFTDVIVFSYIYLSIAYCHVTSARASIIFLLGMCVFDTFWMFGINVLSTVVSETTAPVMILFPTSFSPKSTAVFAKDDYSKLGSVDPLIIGVFMATIYRWSRHRHAPSYVYLNQMGMTLGLFVTCCVSFYREKSTPAMVLPSIFCVTATVLNAARRGEVKAMWGYDDAWWTRISYNLRQRK